MVTITLPADLEAWAREQVASGSAKTLDGLIAEALLEHRRTNAGHQKLVAEAYRQLARGDVMSEQAIDLELDRWIAEDSAVGR